MKQSALLLLTAAMVTTSATAGSYGGAGGSVSGAAEREMARRMARVQEATAAIERGDKLMADGDCEGALNEFRTALDLLPDAPMTAELRGQVNHRFCAAAVCVARERAENGRYADARALLNEAIERHPECEDAKTLLEHLDDPERYEPAMTPEHAANVEEVKRLLAMAYSYLNLGDYDNANTTFQAVLRLDNYNSAARRGMEQVELKRRDYFDTARDHRRAAMLAEVDKAWEEQVPSALIGDRATEYGSGPDDSAYYSLKMREIIFPSVNFSGASIEEAVEFLRIKSRDFDTQERDPSKKGVNLILRQGSTPSNQQISLDLKQVPMDEALRYITELANMKYKVEKFAVVVVPLSEISDTQYTRTFKVPPDFLSGAASGDSGAAPVNDPFATPGGGGGAALAGRPATAKDVLTAAGITFPEGASASFVPTTSELIVRNTQPNLDLIEQYVQSRLTQVPQQIYITTKFVEVTQKNTDELGFDWLLGQFNIGGSARTFGGGGTSGNSGNGVVSPTDFPFHNNGTVIGQNPMTAGNRSGSIALTPDSIDGLLQASNVASSIAPGVFSLAGVFTDPQFQLVIRALSQKKGVDLMSAPSVTCRSGQRAVVEVIREFIYPTEFDPPQIPQTVGATSLGSGDLLGGSTSTFPVTPTTPTTFDMRPVGVRMEVDPVLGPDGFTIDLNLAPEVTEFEGFVNYGSPIQTSATDALGNPTTVILTPNIINQPIFSTRKVTTSVTIWDSQTVAIGGLIREDVQDVEDKVPLLGDIPILGRLFQTKAEDHFKRNLMIFVTAKLIDPSGQPVFRQKQAEPTAPVGGPAPVSMDGGPGLLPAVNP